MSVLLRAGLVFAAVISRTIRRVRPLEGVAIVTSLVFAVTFALGRLVRPVSRFVSVPLAVAVPRLKTFAVPRLETFARLVASALAVVPFPRSLSVGTIWPSEAAVIALFFIALRFRVSIRSIFVKFMMLAFVLMLVAMTILSRSTS